MTRCFFEYISSHFSSIISNNSIIIVKSKDKINITINQSNPKKEHNRNKINEHANHNH